jgi:hypothetical protein
VAVVMIAAADNAAIVSIVLRMIASPYKQKVCRSFAKQSSDNHGSITQP